MKSVQQYCTFFLDGLFFGVEVEKVQEVIRYQQMTRVPLAADVVSGLINLRGQIVTAIDLRRRLGLTALTESDIGAEELELRIAADAILARTLLTYVNSCACGLRSKIDSLRQAIVYLGKSRVQMIATLLFLVSVEGKPHALLQTALIRALACQSLAKSMKSASPDAFFSAGLFSVLDALLDQEMAAAVRAMPFTDELTQALLHHEGEMGKCLAGVIAFEEGRLMDSGATHDLLCRVPTAYWEATLAIESGEGMTGNLGSTIANRALGELCR